MFRRSKSASNIPIPTNIKRDSSTSRYTSVGSKRTSSLDRKSNTEKSSKTSLKALPRTSQQCKTKTNSVKGATPRSTSKASRNTGSIPRTTPDTKSLQKLIRDKDWVVKQYHKVQNFVQNSGLFDPQKANPGNLKPPTIGTFVYMCNVFFKEIFPTIQMIDNTNYKEIVPKHLKLLKYNGAMTNSTLKTVNMPHAFPQVISMFAFLVDLIDISHYDPNIEYFHGDMRQSCELLELFLECSTRDYSNIFLPNNTEATDEDIKEYKNRILQVVNIDMDRYEEQVRLVEKNRKWEETQLLKIDELKASNEVIQNEISDIQQKIDEIEEYLICDEHSLDEEIKVLTSDKLKLNSRKAEMEQELRKVEASIAQQKCSFETKKKMQLEIANLKRRLPLKREEFNDLMKMKDEFDYKMVEWIDQIESEVSKWNSSVKKASIIYPDLQKLLLREKNFNTDSFDQEIKEALENKGLIGKANEQQLGHIKKEIYNLEKLLVVKDDDLIKLKKQLEVLNNEIDELKLILKDSNKELQLLLKNYADEKREYEEKLLILADNGKLNEQEKIIETLQCKKNIMKQDLKKLSKKCVAFFLDLHKIQVTKLTLMDKSMNDVRHDLANTISRAMEAKQKKLDL